MGVGFGAPKINVGTLRGHKQKGVFLRNTSGCAIADGRDEGVTKLLIDD